MEGKCPVCKQKALNKCSNCHGVFYCSKEHQKSHWQDHKPNCKSIIVKVDAVLGRHLVAMKDFKEGDIVLKEKPLIMGPSQMTIPVCLGCCCPLDEASARPCDRCGWPMCSAECQESPNHRPECELTAARGQKIHIKNFGCPHPNYQCITVLRCLHQKRSNPVVWAKLQALESHCEQRRKSPKWQQDLVQVAQFARRFFRLEDDFTEDEIMRVCGIVQVNGHEMPLYDPPFVAIYDTASMVEHNCRANCSKSFTVKGEVIIVAAIPIVKGQHISICYTDPLWGTANRRHHLEETKFFSCSCARCSDVTELGTMFSAIKCQKSDCTGYALPNTFIIDRNDKFSNGYSKEKQNETPNHDWYCNTCNTAVPEHRVDQLIDHVGKDLSAMEKGNVDSCFRFLGHYGKFLHPSHFYMADVTLALAQLIGQDGEGGLPAVPDERLALKMDLCRQVASSLEKLVPAEMRGRGSVLFELHAAIAETGRRRAARTAEGPAILLDYLMDSKRVLEKSAKLLQHEPAVLPEGKIAIQAAKNLVDMETLLQKLYAAADCPMSII